MFPALFAGLKPTLNCEVRGMVRSRASPENLDVRTFVVDVGRLAGFISFKRQPLPGTAWRGCGYLNVRIYRTLRNDDMHRDAIMGS